MCWINKLKVCFSNFKGIISAQKQYLTVIEYEKSSYCHHGWNSIGSVIAWDDSRYEGGAVDNQESNDYYYAIQNAI